MRNQSLTKRICLHWKDMAAMKKLNCCKQPAGGAAGSQHITCILYQHLCELL